MEDLARGERIKALREARRLTQPAMVDLLHKRAGARVVTLRGYQAWEAGGGIRWDNAKILADVLGVDAEELMSGVKDATDLVRGASGAERSSVDQEQLDRIEAKLEANQAKLDAILAALEINAAEPDSLPDRIAGLVRDTAARALPPEPPIPPEAHESTGSTRNRSAGP